MGSQQLATLFLLATAAALAQPPRVEIPFQKFTLDNGLTVIVHEDRKAPIVAVNVWYHVGSKNEKIGKTGFAHLFEHLMFNGSEHYNKDYFQVLERLGATDLNGTTNEDRTNYFQNVPTPALDTVLWMESDRMGYMLGAVDQARLDEQRGVVQNEKRQGENQPYGQAFNLIVENTYPQGHPYSWTVIGHMEDLNRASLEDVREWFKAYYGPSNAVLVLAGDIDLKTAREKVEKYFGAIPPGPPVARQSSWIAKMNGTHRQVMEDRVPQARIYKVWNVPPSYTADLDLLDLVSDLVGAGKTSRLHKRLVYQDQIATDAQAFLDAREIGSQFYIQATARPGVDLKRVEQAVDEELKKFLEQGPTPEEVERVRTRHFANFLRGVERVGGFGGKSDVLARGQVFGGDPASYKQTLDRVAKVTAADLKAAANRWLADGVYALEVHPFPKLKNAPKDVDRSKVPEAGAPPELKLPPLERMTLSNGLKVVLAQRHELPLVNFRLLVDSGFSADPAELPGTAKLAMQMIDEGTRTRNALEISDQLDGLGAVIGTNANLDQCQVSASALKSKLDATLDLYADVILNPTFPAADFAREQKQTLAAIQREKSQPGSIAMRVLPGLIYGKNHPYGNPLTGSGTEAAVSRMTRDDLVRFHQTWFKPNNATLIVVGDTTPAELKPKLEKLFAGWKAGEVPRRNIAQVEHREKRSVYLIDRPGAQQSVIIAGHVAPPTANPNEIAIETMNNVLGGAFISRLNMNLREDKHWAYGASTFMVDATGQRPFMAFAPVQTDKTRESMVEMDKELREIIRQRPVSAEELSFSQDNQTLTLPGSRETLVSLVNSITEITRFGLPDDHFQTYSGKVRALKREDISAAAERVLRPDRTIWVVVGDLSKIEKGVRDLNFGEVQVLDANLN